MKAAAARLLTFRRLGAFLVRESMLTRDEITAMLESAGAMRHGHFELSSGRHSGTYIQCALGLQFPQHADSLGRALAEIFRDHKFACVVSPALGGVIIGHE